MTSRRTSSSGLSEFSSSAARACSRGTTRSHCGRFVVSCVSEVSLHEDKLVRILVLVVSRIWCCLLIKLVLRRGSGVANDGSSFLIKRVQRLRDGVNQELPGFLLFIWVKGYLLTYATYNGKLMGIRWDFQMLIWVHNIYFMQEYCVSNMESSGGKKMKHKEILYQ